VPKEGRRLVCVPRDASSSRPAPSRAQAGRQVHVIRVKRQLIPKFVERRNRGWGGKHVLGSSAGGTCSVPPTSRVAVTSAPVRVALPETLRIFA